MFSDDQLLPISALQHLLFCRRRAALVHIEGLWAENRFTVEGQQLHQRAHDPGRGESRAGVQVARGLELRSYRLGLTGKADVVEFHTERRELERVVLVEYKRGRPKPALDEAFHVQLCAQALCLEEMLGRPVSQAVIFFGGTRQRCEVPLDQGLRARTLSAIRELHELIAAGRTPVVRYARKCRRCSLLHLCLPKSLRPRATAAHYLLQVISTLDDATS